MSQSITQDLKFKQSVVKYAIKHNNNAAAARKYKLTREYVRFWRSRYDGSLNSLRELSRAPKSPKNKQSDDQINIVKHTYKYNKYKQRLEMFVIAKRKGYIYSYYTFTRTINKLFNTVSNTKSKYKPKPYNTPSTPGEKIQLDVKYAPRATYNNPDERWCQYTFIDEASRVRYLHPAREANTFETIKALESAIIYFAKKGIQIKTIQTDNGREFTNRFADTDKLSFFELRLLAYEIDHKLIKPYTPRHNGKVERSHRNDNERFYSRNTFSSFEDFCKKLKRHNHNYNNFPIISLNFKTPIEILNRCA